MARLVYDATDGLRDAFATERVTAYIGFDPTASSLHVGSLLPVMALARLQRFGHTPIAHRRRRHRHDRRSERQVAGARRCCRASRSTRTSPGIRPQLARFLDFERAGQRRRASSTTPTGSARSICSAFLRDTGKYFTVNYMLQKESVNRRLESEDGISFTEFSYLLLQARDFLELFDRYGCTLQMGGSDQWGNITAGIDLIRKLRAKKAHGLVMPLVTTASGVKFGKTEAGTIWLDPARTSPFKFYQFWLNTDDRDVVALPEVLHVPRARRDRRARRGDARARRRSARRSACSRAR